ncbi:hypothetical protein H1Q59_02405 [Holosporaceae bacterium 'Namur']|nr:hypothetical protein [Holosporaceae bacterium 'Namur']
MIEDIKYFKELERLRFEQELLEEEINELMKGKVINQFLIFNLIKRKGRVKESIATICSTIYTNIIA